MTYVGSIVGRTDRTVEAYYVDIRTFLRYLVSVKHTDIKDTPFERIPIKDVPFSYVKEFTMMDAYEYMNYLIDVRKNSNKTRARKTSSLRKFYEFLSTYRSPEPYRLETNPLEKLEHPKAEKSLPKYLELDQSKELLDDVKSENYLRDYCILTIFLNCGLRLSELAGLDIDDYSESARTLRVFGKGQKERIVYLNDACISALNAYLEVRPKSVVDPNAIFLSSYHDHRRLSNRRIQRIVEDQLEIAGLGNLGISPHKLRHTAATLMYEYGDVDPIVLKDVLGHVSVATTEIYTHLSNKDRKSAVESSPLADMKATGNGGKQVNESEDDSDDSPAND
ncbi:MAG: tyrosine-type recombinase/integrase [Oscillospiraceae bacterium]|nr:tyrosine-type recombinase/integrase [Ruminococcus sp.]MCD8345655.1 tyrosine-type recombinase/integrase [Oscillospiraceae bacterium]